jgi:hypothetical protein
MSTKDVPTERRLGLTGGIAVKSAAKKVTEEGNGIEKGGREAEGKISVRS